MRRVQQVAGVVILAFTIHVMVEASRLVYYTPLGPGPGFFPFWLGLLLAGLSITWIAQVSLRPVDIPAEGFVPTRAGMARILAILLAVALFGLLVDWIGFQLMMFAFLMFLLFALGRQNVLLTLLISLAGSFGVYHGFTNWLDVHLPPSSIEFLQNLGL